MNSEPGHIPNRWYADQNGDLHLNGAALHLDEVGSTITAALFISPAATFVPGNLATIAAAGATQGTATPITTSTAVVTGANGTKGVQLPVPTYLNQEINVLNTVGASVLEVYPDSGGTGGTINGGAANAAASLAGGKGATYVCIGLSPTAWWSTSN